MTQQSSALVPPAPGHARAQRVYTALIRLVERHASSVDARQRRVNVAAASPHEAIRLVAILAGGSATYAADEPAVDDLDLAAALTLVPVVRADLDELELSLLLIARGRGMTWSTIAFCLGLGSGQAAQQRHDRLANRVDPPRQ